MRDSYFPVPVRVRYAETDQMGVVHHSAYPIWFEVARSEFSRATSLSYAQWEELGVFLMVSELRCRFRRSARYGQIVTVWVRVSSVASRKAIFEYRVTAPSGELLVEGETHHLAVDRSTGHPIMIPAICRRSLLEQPSAERENPGQNSFTT